MNLHKSKRFGVSLKTSWVAVKQRGKKEESRATIAMATVNSHERRASGLCRF